MFETGGGSIRAGVGAKLKLKMKMKLRDLLFIIFLAWIGGFLIGASVAIKIIARKHPEIRNEQLF